jgi:hypothetical protein
MHIDHFNNQYKSKSIMLSSKTKLEEDLDFHQKKIHLFNLFDLHYQQGASSAKFYHELQNAIIANLKKKGDIITWRNSMVLTEDEQLSPTFEELVLAVVLSLIDIRLPGHVLNQYCHLLGQAESIMDYRTDILGKVPTFLSQIEAKKLDVTKNIEDSLDR